MENLERILAEQPFLSGMKPEHIKLLAGCAKNVAFKAGEYLFHEGEAADFFYFVRQGKIWVETFIPQKGPVAIQSLKEGEVLGWSWMIPPYKWHFDARAFDLTRALALDAVCLREKCEKDHDLGYELISRFALIFAQRLEATRLQLMDIYGNSTKNK
jgi:CRP-like cAMP-binding protein